MNEQERLKQIKGMLPIQCYNDLILELMRQATSGSVEVEPTKTFGEVMFQKLDPQIQLLDSTMKEYDLDLDTALEMQLGLFRGLKREDEAVFFTKAAAHAISING